MDNEEYRELQMQNGGDKDRRQERPPEPPEPLRERRDYEPEPFEKSDPLPDAIEPEKDWDRE